MSVFNLKDLKGSIDSTIVDITGGSTKTAKTDQEIGLAKSILCISFYMFGLVELTPEQEDLVEENHLMAFQAGLKKAKEKGKPNIRTVTVNAYRVIEETVKGSEGFPYCNKKGQPALRWDAVLFSIFRKAYEELGFEVPDINPEEVWKDHAKISRDRKKEAEG